MCSVVDESRSSLAGLDARCVSFLPEIYLSIYTSISGETACLSRGRAATHGAPPRGRTPLHMVHEASRARTCSLPAKLLPLTPCGRAGVIANPTKPAGADGPRATEGPEARRAQLPNWGGQSGAGALVPARITSITQGIPRTGTLRASALRSLGVRASAHLQPLLSAGRTVCRLISLRLVVHVRPA
eukprot:scaffold29527_cov74-Phaeocystis_antarctica.AAC.6